MTQEASRVVGKPCMAPERFAVVRDAGRTQAASQGRERAVQPRLCSNTSGCSAQSEGVLW